MRGRDWERLEALYGRSRRSLEKWRGAPLEEPSKMAAWWRANRKQKVPERVLELEAGGVPEEPGEPVDLAAFGGSSVGESVERARSLVALAWSKLEEAMRGGRASEISRWSQAWEKAQAIQRQWEKDLVRIQTEQGAVCSVGEIAAELVPRLTTIRRAFEAELERLAGLEESRRIAARVWKALEGCRFLGEEERLR